MSIVSERAGSGEPVVLVHGLGSRRGAWRPVADLLAGEREVIGVDLPGFGESPHDGTEPSVTGLADRLERFFSDEGLDRPHVAGNSLGGGIVLELGRRGAVRSVTAFSPTGFGRRTGKAWARGILKAGVTVGRNAPTEVPDHVRVATGRPAIFLYSSGHPWRLPAAEVLEIIDSGVGAPCFDRALELSKEFDFDDPGRLPELPVTIAWGTRDVLLTFATQSRRARRLAPFARHVTLPRCGHVPFFDDPERCADLILQTSAG